MPPLIPINSIQFNSICDPRVYSLRERHCSHVTTRGGKLLERCLGPREDIKLQETSPLYVYVGYMYMYIYIYIYISLFMTHATRALQSHDLSGEETNPGSHTYFSDHIRSWRASPDNGSASMPWPPPRKHKRERRYTPFT